MRSSDKDRDKESSRKGRTMKKIYFTIAVKMPGLDLVGYVANSVYTVKGESWSAGRLYDRFGKKATGTVKIVLPDAVICKLDKPKK